MDKERNLEPNKVPFFLDFAFTLPEGVEIESNCKTRDSVTWGEHPSDDD